MHAFKDKIQRDNGWEYKARWIFPQSGECVFCLLLIGTKLHVALNEFLLTDE